jgi:phage/plasmid primase-like uncharacterized protein
LRDGSDGQLLVHCFSGCDYDDLLPELVEYGLLDDADDADYYGRPEPDKREKIELARQIYSRLQPAAATLGERYLLGRAISLPVPPILRFGACPHHSGLTLPALAAPITDASGEQIGIHLTFLRGDGTKVARDTVGRVSGGMLCVATAGPELAVAEGLESALSVMQILGRPAWSAICASNLKSHAWLPAETRCVIIAADNDVAGRQSAAGAKHRWLVEGRSVRTIMPKIPKDDFNDVLRRGHNAE